jgi:hypothetical protein
MMTMTAMVFNNHVTIIFLMSHKVLHHVGVISSTMSSRYNRLTHLRQHCKVIQTHCYAAIKKMSRSQSVFVTALRRFWYAVEYLYSEWKAKIIFYLKYNFLI